MKSRPYSGTLPEWGYEWYSNLTFGTNSSINPFFYGTYLGPTSSAEIGNSTIILLPFPSILLIFLFILAHRSQKQSYQYDAIGSLGQLTPDHFKNFHLYRLEWDPNPKTGYLRWYLDNEFMFGIEASSLSKYGGIIPQEPSYIIINTAISTSWGFPNLPTGCPSTYDCKDPKSICGFHSGFCPTLPAEFLIDYVRVYQKEGEDNTGSGNSTSYQSIGCNPKAFPTKRFIQAHANRYKDDPYKKKILEDIKIGGGKCKSNNNCGRESKCIRGKCQCVSPWVGPHCLVPHSGNPFPDWDEEETTLFKNFSKPFFSFPFLSLLLFLLVVFVSIIIYVVYNRKINKNSSNFTYMPISSEL